MHKPPARWALAYVRFRHLWLAIALCLTVFMGYQATGLQFNFSPDNIHLSDDPANHLYRNVFQKAFGESAGICVVGIEGDLTDPKTQIAIRDMHETLVDLAVVKAVRSLVNLEVAGKDGESKSILPDLIGNPSESVDPRLRGEDRYLKGRGEDRYLKLAAAEPLFEGFFINKALTASAMVIKTPLLLGQQEAKEKLAHDLTNTVDLVAARHPHTKFYLTGAPIIQEATVTILKNDQLFFVPMVVLLMALLLWISFRSFRGILLPFLATGVATVWALGWLTIVGHPLDIVNNALVVLLLVISIADAVHLLSRYEDEFALNRRENSILGKKPDKLVAVAKTVQCMTLPCLFTTTTTALGFASSIVADVDIIKNFGLDAAVGVMGAFFATLFIIPSLLAFMPAPRKRLTQHEKADQHRWSIDHILERLAHWSLVFAQPIAIMSLVIFFGAAFLAKDIESNQTLSGELPASSPPVAALNFMDENLSGTMPFDVLLQGDADRLREADVILAGAKIANHIRHLPLTPRVNAFSDILAAVQRKISDHPTPVNTWDEDQVAQMLLLLDMEAPERMDEILSDFYGDEGKVYRITGMVKNTTTLELSKMRDKIETYLESIKLVDVKIGLTGSSMIMARALDNIVDDMLASLALAFVTIFFFVWLLFRSLKLAFIALFPNILPIVITVGTMQFLGISLRVATVIIFSMALGIAVDACIHLLTRFKEEAQGKDMDTIERDKNTLEWMIKRTLRGSGRPVVYATFMLLVGFSALFFSTFFALRDFAILSAITLSAALLIDIILLPALLFLMKPKFT